MDKYMMIVYFILLTLATYRFSDCVYAVVETALNLIIQHLIVGDLTLGATFIGIIIVEHMRIPCLHGVTGEPRTYEMKTVRVSKLLHQYRWETRNDFSEILVIQTLQSLGNCGHVIGSVITLTSPRHSHMRNTIQQLRQASDICRLTFTRELCRTKYKHGMDFEVQQDIMGVQDFSVIPRRAALMLPL